MKIKLLVPNVKPCSINKAYYSRNKVLTKAAREYRLGFLHSINHSEANQDLMQAFKAAFDSTKHCIHLSMLFMIPEDIYFNKKGEISMRGGDVDNYIKLTTDFLFNSKYYDDPCRLEGMNCFNLGIDDRYISDITVAKKPAHDWAIQLEISIQPIDSVIELPELNSQAHKWDIVKV